MLLTSLNQKAFRKQLKNLLMMPSNSLKNLAIAVSNISHVHFWLGKLRGIDVLPIHGCLH